VVDVPFHFSCILSFSTITPPLVPAPPPLFPCCLKRYPQFFRLFFVQFPLCVKFGFSLVLFKPLVLWFFLTANHPLVDLTKQPFVFPFFPTCSCVPFGVSVFFVPPGVPQGFYLRLYVLRAGDALLLSEVEFRLPYCRVYSFSVLMGGSGCLLGPFHLCRFFPFGPQASFLSGPM